MAFPQGEKLISSVREISDKDGLQYREIFCSYQDSRGFIWFGTQYGLVKFDGHAFTYFNKENDGLESNNIHQIIEDESGVLWLATYNTWHYHLNVGFISFFDSHTNKVIHNLEARASTNIELDGKMVNRIASSKTHRINLFDWKQNYYPYRPGKGYLPKRNVPGNDVDFMDAKVLCYTTQRDVLSLAKAFYDEGIQSGVERLKWSTEKGYEYAEIIHQVEPDRYYVADYRSASVLHEWSPGNWRRPLPVPYPILDRSNLTVNVGYLEKDGSIWYGSSSDFFVYYPESGDFIDFKKEFPDYFQGKGIHDIHFGTRGEVFVCTNDGFYIVTVKANPFSKYLYADPRNENPSILNSCRTIFQWGDSLVVSHSPYYRSVISLKTGQITSREKVNLGMPSVLSHESILMNEQTNTMVRYWPAIKKKTTYYLDDHIAWPWCMHIGKDSTVLIGFDNGAWAWKEGTTSLSRIEKWKGYASSLISSTVYQFLDVSDEGLLMATSGGIFYFDWEKGITGRYWTGGKGKYYFPFDDVLHIQPAKDGQFWVATQGGGLIKWDRGSGWYRQYTTENGLPSNIIYAVYEDDNRTLWMPTYQGIAAFSIVKGLFTVFTEQDGITHNEFNRISHFQAPDRRLYFGGLNGVTAFYPSDLENESLVQPPTMYLTSFKQYEHDMNKVIDKTEAFHANPSITILPRNTFSSLTVAMLDYGSLAQLHYDYKLEGRDQNWRPLLANSLELGGLPFGQYTLTIRGQNLRNQYEPQLLQIPVHVVRPIYLCWWFFVLCGLFGIGLAFLFFRKKTLRLARQKERLEQEVQRRTATIIEQQKEIETDKRRINEQAVEIEILDRVIRTSQMLPEEANWLGQLEAIIENKMSDPHFKAQDLATAMHLSRTQFHRKLKALTDLAPGAWLQETRLQKAKELLENNTHDSIKAVAYEVGINPGYFAEAYRKRFGKLPSEQ